MEVIKIYNNNILAVLTEDDQIALITGKGVGYKAREKAAFVPDKNCQIFKLSKPNREDIYAMIDHIDADSLEISRKIFNKAKETAEYPVSNSLLLHLADHITFKVEMLNQNIVVPNLLMTEVKYFYPKEFSVGQFGVQLINTVYKAKFDDNEAAYLALHIVNSSLQGNSTDVYKITEFIKEMLNIINGVYSFTKDTQSWHYERLTVHLKFLAQRLLHHEQDADDPILGKEVLEITKEDFPKITAIVNKANALTTRLFDKRLSHNEEIYLSIHVLRIKQIQGGKYE